MALDVIVTGGTVVDGTGAPARRADIGVAQGRIVTVDERLDDAHASRIDAAGLVVAPGFIDSHAHVDGQLFWDPLATPSSWNGYTTLVAGNCGFSLAGASRDADYGVSLMAGVEQIPRSLLTAQVPFTWEGFGGYAATLERAGLGVNVASFAGYPMARHQVMGDRGIDDIATEEELTAIEGVLRQALDEGALGLSLNRYGGDRDDRGLRVAGWDAPWDEIRRMVGLLAARPGTLLQALPRWFMSGDGQPDLEADEMELQSWISVLRECGRRLVWGPMVDGRSDVLLSYGHRAAEAGAELIAGAHPVPVAGMTTFALAQNIFATIPSWHFLFDLDSAEQVRVLSDPAVRDRLRAAATEEHITVFRGTTFDDGGQVVSLGDPLHFPWDGMIFIGSAPDRFDLSGRTVGAEARATGRAPVDVLLDAVVASRGSGFFYTPLSGYSTERSIEILRDPHVVLSGNDTGAHLQRLCQQGSTILLSRYVRELGALTLEEAVHLLTGRQATVFGLVDRGVLRPGFAADMVLFDPERIDPIAPEVQRDLPGGGHRIVTRAKGIERLVVNGTTVVEAGRSTGAVPGRVLTPAGMAAARALA
jgi:N-acyl-D-amino-acid deacylase